MKTFDLFVVEIHKLTNDSIKTKSGLELYVDTRFDEFGHRTTSAPVVAVPFKYDTGVQPGDTLYFHHLVVLNEGQVLTGEDNHYLVRYDPEHTINNQAIAFKSKETGEITPLKGWALLEYAEEDADIMTDAIEIIKIEKNLPTIGRISFYSKEMDEYGLKVGDLVGFKQNRDYRIKIEGTEYYRIRLEDLLYVREEV